MSASWTTPVHRPIRIARPIGLATGLTVLTLAVLFLVSSKVLQAVGIPYASTGGSPLTKFHPATFLALAALGTWAIVIGPGRLLAALAAQRPGILVFAMAIGLLTFQTAVVQQLPISAVVDTFVLPLALFISILALRATVMERLVIALHLFFLLNSTLGYAEYFTGWRLTPNYEGGALITYDWRSTALLGHPLINALATGVYLLILSGPGGRRFDLPIRTFLLIYSLGAMVAFGGRAATVMALALLTARGLLSLVKILAGRPFGRRDALAVIVVLTLIATIGSLLVQGGVLDTFLSRFEDDSGSAATRVAMFHIFDGMALRDVFFAPDLGHVASNQRRLDLAIGIESFVVAFFAYYGIVTTVIFFAGLVFFGAEIIRTVGTPGLIPLAYFFLVSSTSTGVANKTTDMALIMAMILIGLDRRFIPPISDGRS
ncbi:VpsF family polysaccharide biosynthesis protein [Kaistia defluvii]|uniref:VpsF family polysaccharide biosynthesis protein n=1 Tax=Kaistia defluvii TaxID=410841 RepID=UPI002250C748|nr:VpsF family polysaccharide biosynthesis protein [Kaistia defluvii]MCX5519163.1 VpsF family polysaccharide biosynthesis protein [Kaistia defluvii]